MPEKIIKVRSPLVDSSIYPEQLPAILKRVYANRGVDCPSKLELGLARLPHPKQLTGLSAAVELLEAHLRERKRILIVGDYDADGATASALAVRGLHAMGAESVGYLVPNRFDDGYGLTPAIVEAAKARKPDLLITVDNGISSIQGALAAQEAGFRLLITDHHLPGETLPVADAIVNPNLKGDDFPSKNLAGVGVMFYVLLALRSALRDSGWFEERGLADVNLAQWLDLVALGTVADVVPLDHCNRILVEQGLRRIRAGRCVSGITALLEIANRNPERAVASDMGFAVGPRLNAAGRLQDMSTGIECLLSDDAAQCQELALQLDAINRERREVEAEMRAEAELAVDALQLEAGEGNELPVALTLYEPHWHAGVVGLVAGRIKERFHRPVFAFAEESDDSLKGSGRSIQGLHIRDVLADIDSDAPGLITKFGGHAMAAGLSLPKANLEAFQSAFQTQVNARLTADQLQAILVTDGELEANELTLNTAEFLRQAGPWGQAFPEPLFSGQFEVLRERQLRGNHLKLVVTHPQQPSLLLDAIFFGYDGDMPGVGANVEVVYRFDINEFQGRRFPQLLLQDLRHC